MPEKAPVKKQGEYTVADYMNYPEDKRIELIDGVIYDMAAATSTHQAIAGEIFHQVMSFIFSRKGSCFPLMSPVDVQLDCDDTTMVQPDVLVLCDRSKLKHGRVFGAPDFIVEVLSPATRRKDMTLKLSKYANAGVREYWMVDSQKKSIIVYRFVPEDLIVEIHGFAERVPVGIYNNECVIDFVQVQEWLDMYGEEENAD